MSTKIKKSQRWSKIYCLLIFLQLAPLSVTCLLSTKLQHRSPVCESFKQELMALAIKYQWVIHFSRQTPQRLFPTQYKKPLSCSVELPTETLEEHESNGYRCHGSKCWPLYICESDATFQGYKLCDYIAPRKRSLHTWIILYWKW